MQITKHPLPLLINKNSTLLKPTQLPTLSIIGAGKLGKTLARMWFDNSTVNIQQIINQTQSSSLAAKAFIGSGTPCDTLSDLKPSDFLLIAVPDSDIETVAKKLLALELNWTNTVIFHCSGSLSSSVLSCLKSDNTHIASAHPLHSFADPAHSIQQLKHCFCCAEGDDYALEQLYPLFQSLGMHWKVIEQSQKLVYHAAAVFACNFLPSIINASHECLEVLGFSPQQANEMLLPLARQTLTNIEKTSPNAALTGPVQRGDVSLIESQITALENTSPELASFYKMLSSATLKLTDHKNTSPETHTELSHLFNSDSD